jgi:integrase
VTRRLEVPRSAVVADGDDAGRRALGRDELARHLGAAPRARDECVLRLAGETDLRLGEVIGLLFDDLDLPNRRITVRRSVWQRAGRSLPDATREKPERIAKPPKGGRARIIAISAALSDALSRWYEEAVLTLGHAADGPCFLGRAADYVYTSCIPNDADPHHERGRAHG